MKNLLLILVALMSVSPAFAAEMSMKNMDMKSTRCGQADDVDKGSTVVYDGTQKAGKASAGSARD